MSETIYHIYVNDQCIYAALSEEEFTKEMTHIKAFLELTHLDNSAKLDYVRCEPSSLAQIAALADGSY